MTFQSSQFTFGAIILRLCLAVLSAGVIGYGRTRRGRTAGFRTYMLTGVGACLSILLASYDYQMLTGGWSDIVAEVGMKFDASRYAAQVLSGVGFLAAGSIIATDHQQVEGLTTAAGLFASVCMGLAAGAGFYLCVVLSLVLILLSLNVMAPLETAFKRRHRNMTIYVIFHSAEDLQKITDLVNEKEGTILGIDVERTVKEKDLYPSAILSIRMGKEKASHSEMLSSIAELPCVVGVEELIS